MNDNEQINLGHEVPDYGAALGGGEPNPKSDTPTRTDYPEVHLHDLDEHAAGAIPDEGELVVGHKVVGREMRTDEKGKKKHSVRLQLHHAKVHRSGKRSKHKFHKTDDDEKAVDRYFDGETEAAK